MKIRCVLAALLSLVALSRPVCAVVATQPTSQPTTMPAVAIPTFDKPAIAKLYQDELGALFDPANLTETYHAHLLLEEYFSSTNAAQRKQAVALLQKTKIPVETLGRLARLHIDWPDLKSGIYYVNEKSGPYEIKYFFGLPNSYDRTHSWPLVIKLPTEAAFDTNPPPNGDQVAEIYKGWLKDELAAHPDAVVIMPLLNLDRLYGPSTVGMNYVIQPMLNITAKADIDPARIYMIGHSMAAHAVWNIAISYPTYFAAINPLAGAAREPWQRLRMGNLLNVLPVVWADASDKIINVDESRSIVKYLRNIKYDVDYEETTTVGHGPTQAIVDEEYAKLRARTRELYPKEVFIQSNRAESIFNRADWLQIYEPLDAGEIKKYIIARAGDPLLMYDRSFRAVGTIVDRHTIKIETLNVESLRIYLNDQMVDLSQPVTVIVNGRQRFSAIVVPSVEEMLKDQNFLGRGMRYYTAAIDLDLTDPTSRPAGEATTKPAHHGSIEIVTPDGQHKVYEGN